MSQGEVSELKNEKSNFPDSVGLTIANNQDTQERSRFGKV